jgi:hypothetical protein
MKKNKKYLEAAELLICSERVYGQTPGCCYVLKKAKKRDYNFHTMFKPEDDRDAGYSDYYFGPLHNDESNLARSLALLFMYEMGEN